MKRFVCFSRCIAAGQFRMCDGCRFWMHNRHDARMIPGTKKILCFIEPNRHINVWHTLLFQCPMIKGSTMRVRLVEVERETCL